MATVSIRKRWMATFVFGSLGVAGAVALSTGCGGSTGVASEEVTSGDASTSTTPNACANADLQSDNANCGSCGNACANGEVCSRGACATSCGGGTTLCGSSCADTKVDSDNCGGCGTKCASGEVCSNGTCGSSCSAGQTLCGGSGGAAYCADTTSDNANCGACGNVCGQGLACSNGKCPALTVTGGSYSLPDEDAGGCTANSGGSATFTLLNERDASVDLEWVDPSCAEVSYGTAATGGTIGIGTYVNHVWRVRDDADGGLIGEFVLTSQDTYTVEVH